MKTILRLSMILTFILVQIAVLFAQAPPTPPSNAGSGGGPVGGNAPVGDGLWVLLAGGMLWGVCKLIVCLIGRIESLPSCENFSLPNLRILRDNNYNEFGFSSETQTFGIS